MPKSWKSPFFPLATFDQHIFSHRETLIGSYFASLSPSPLLVAFGEIMRSWVCNCKLTLLLRRFFFSLSNIILWWVWFACKSISYHSPNLFSVLNIYESLLQPSETEETNGWRRRSLLGTRFLSLSMCSSISCPLSTLALYQLVFQLHLLPHTILLPRLL